MIRELIKVTSTGNFNKTIDMLKRSSKYLNTVDLRKYGEKGVNALREATPKDSGLTATSWKYKIEKEAGKTSLTFYNSNVQNGVPIAIILQYGHGTRNGGWVEGYDYINPAIRPVFKELADAAWREVKGK